ELHTVLERTAALGLEMLVVEVIHGIDDEFVSYFGYLDEGGAPLLQFTKRKLRQDPIHFGIATYHATTHDPEVAELGLRFLRAARASSRSAAGWGACSTARTSPPPVSTIRSRRSFAPRAWCAARRRAGQARASRPPTSSVCSRRPNRCAERRHAHDQSRRWTLV